MSLKGTKVLVAGGTGFIGANLVERLLSMGAHVRSTLHHRPKVITDPRVEYVQGDLTTMETCKKAVDGMDYVFMCAANTSGAAVMTSTPLVHVTPNLLMNSQLMEAAYFANVKKFLFISSSTVYPPSGDKPVDESQYRTGEPYDVYYPVGWMKRYSEVLCYMYAKKLKRTMPTVIIRPSNVFGPYDDFDFKTSHMMAALVRRVVERHTPMEVWGDGNDIKDLIYIDDFIDGMLAAFEKATDHLAINIAYGKGYSVKEVLKMILEADSHTKADVRFDSSKPTMIPIRLIDTSMAQQLLGFKPKVSIEEGIQRLVKWYRSNPFKES